MPQKGLLRAEADNRHRIEWEIRHELLERVGRDRLERRQIFFQRNSFSRGRFRDLNHSANETVHRRIVNTSIGPYDKRPRADEMK